MDDYTEYKSQLQIGPDGHKDYLILDRLCCMTENVWLKQNAPGYHKLKLEERLAIIHFVFLWSLFEAKVLNRRASARKIIDATKRWVRDGSLTKESFEPEFSYFRNRYIVDGKFKPRFKRLHLRRNDSPELVKRVLRKIDANPGEVATATLIIVYRIRCNLFHGVKWSSKLRGQFDNFNHANAALIKAIDLNDEVTKKKRHKI